MAFRQAPHEDETRGGDEDVFLRIAHRGVFGCATGNPEESGILGDKRIAAEVCIVGGVPDEGAVGTQQNERLSCRRSFADRTKQAIDVWLH